MPALVHLFLDPPSRGGHELPGGVVEEQDGSGVHRQDIADAIQQLDEELLHGQMGEAGIGQRLDVSQPPGHRSDPAVASQRHALGDYSPGFTWT